MASRNNKKNRSATRSGGSGSSERSPRTDGDAPRHPALRTSTETSTETKASRRTTELAVYVALVLAVVMAALAVDADGRGGEDPFGAQEALRYITVLTIGYMLARGAAKAGSHRRATVRRGHATGHLAAEQDLTDDRDDHEHDRSEARTGSNEPAGDVGHGPVGTTDGTTRDQTSYLLPAPDGHTHQDGHAHEPGHPHDDGHVHGHVVTDRR